MKHKIYLVTYDYLIYDTWGIYAICSTEEKAREKKRELENKIKDLKQQYKKKHGSEYDDDRYIYQNAGFGEEDFPDNYEEISNKVILFDAEHKELTYDNITIEEKDLN